MNLIHILIDLENVKPTASEMRLVCGPQYRLWLFRGPHQNKFDAEIVEQLQPLGDRVRHIRSDKSGKNALDFHIAFYLGRMIPGLEIAVAPGEKSASFFIISKDSGFDVLLGHIRELGYGAARMASVREALGVDEATDVADTPEPAAKMALPKKVVAVKPVASAKRTPTPAAQPAKPKAKPAAPQPKKISKPDPWSRAIENLRDGT